MADYREKSGYCYTCRKCVLARQEQASHTFWLLASVLTCGVFAIVWIISMLVKSGAPAKCAFCGSPVSLNSPAAGQTAMRGGQFGAGTMPKQGLPTAAKIVIGLVCVFVLMPLAIAVLGTAIKPVPAPVAAPVQTPQAVAPSPTPASAKTVKNAKKSAQTKNNQLADGYKLTEAEGSLRGYALACKRQADELGGDTEFKVRNFVYERCIQLDGDGDTAKREIITMIHQSRGK